MERGEGTRAVLGVRRDGTRRRGLSPSGGRGGGRAEFSRSEAVREGGKAARKDRCFVEG